MRSIRRVGGVAVAGLLLSVLVGGPANAQTTPVTTPLTTPPTYTGTASAQALKISIATVSTTEGASTAKASSDGTSEGSGAGVLGQANTTATAKNPPGETKPEVCGDAGLNAVEAAIRNVLVLGLGCGSASATGTGLETVATANGKVAAVDVNLAGLGLTIPTQVDSVTTTVTNSCSTVPTTAIPGTTVTLRDVCLALANSLTTTVQSIDSSKALSAEFGGSTSGVSVSGASVTTEATASGATIKLLPEATLNGVPLGEPLVTISIARANAKVVCDLSNGSAVPSFDPAIVRVKFAAILAAALPAIPDALPKITLPGVGEVDANVSLTEDGSFTVTPGAKVVLFAGLPLQTEIIAGAGSSKVNPDGSATAVSDAVKVHALQLAPAPLTGGILANLAHAEAAGACVAGTSITPPAPPVPEVTRELPRTGGPGAPWMPLVGVAGLALAVVSRRAVLRTR